jgi:cytochrome c-type biogenesis protein CcmE
VKKAYWTGAVILLGFLGLGLSTFSKSMTPYVTFAEAKAEHRTVQVMGALEKGTSRYDTAAKVLHFNIVEEKTGHVLAVTYTDVKPANFEDAVSIVAIGRVQGGTFAAEKLLVKCPSKYQGEEVHQQAGAKVGNV